MVRNVIATTSRTHLQRDPNNTLGAKDGARQAAGQLAKQLYRIRGTYLENEATFNPDERDFIVDSGVSMHVMRKMELPPEELETVKVSRLPTTVISTNVSIDTTEEATLHAKEDVDMFVMVQLPEDTPAVLYLRNPGKKIWY